MLNLVIDNIINVTLIYLAVILGSWVILVAFSESKCEVQIGMKVWKLETVVHHYQNLNRQDRDFG